MFIKILCSLVYSIFNDTLIEIKMIKYKIILRYRTRWIIRNSPVDTTPMLSKDDLQGGGMYLLRGTQTRIIYSWIWRSRDFFQFFFQDFLENSLRNPSESEI